jgi:hypothetical protein
MTGCARGRKGWGPSACGPFAPPAQGCHRGLTCRLIPVAFAPPAERPTNRRVDEANLGDRHATRTDRTPQGRQAIYPPRQKGVQQRQVDVGRSLSADRRSKAKTIVKKGEGDRGDQRSDWTTNTPCRSRPVPTLMSVSEAVGGECDKITSLDAPDVVRVNGCIDEKKDQIHEDKVPQDSQSGDHRHTRTDRSVQLQFLNWHQEEEDSEYEIGPARKQNRRANLLNVPKFYRPAALRLWPRCGMTARQYARCPRRISLRDGAPGYRAAVASGNLHTFVRSQRHRRACAG